MICTARSYVNRGKRGQPQTTATDIYSLGVVLHKLLTGVAPREQWTEHSKEDLPRLFREFEQLPQPNGVRPEGTGLGLALTRRLVELHGGKVTVESALGTGSTFSVFLPLKSPDEITLIRLPDAVAR